MTSRDESDPQRMRIVIELKRDANPQVVMNRCFAQTAAAERFAINMLAAGGTIRSSRRFCPRAI